MKNLELRTGPEYKVGEISKPIKTDSKSERTSQQASTIWVFDLAEYLRNSKKYVLGHAAFTK